MSSPAQNKAIRLLQFAVSAIIILGSLPVSAATPLDGKVDVKDFGDAGLVVAVDLAKELAGEICNGIDSGSKVVIYNQTVTSGIVSARILEKQLGLYQELLKKTLEPSARVPPQYKTYAEGLIVPGVSAVTDTIKAIVDLASLFKTDVTVAKSEFSDSDSLLVTAMAQVCSDKISNVGIGYMGELDMQAFEKLHASARSIILDRAILDNRIGEVKKELDAVDAKKEAAKKQELQSRFDALSSVAKLVDGFIAAIKPNEISDSAPLISAAKYLSLSTKIAGSDMLDFKFKLQGLTILKNNLFTGQHLRLSATGIVWYRIQDASGSIKRAQVIRKLAKPVQVDLRGDDANDRLWNGN